MEKYRNPRATEGESIYKPFEEFLFMLFFMGIPHEFGGFSHARVKKWNTFTSEHFRVSNLINHVTLRIRVKKKHIVTSHIMDHADRNNILYPLQHGFRSKRSCETQLIEFIDETSNNMASGKQTDVLIMDFSKAFDKVSHSLLAHKLEHYGIRGKTNNWIKKLPTRKITGGSCRRRNIRLHQRWLRRTTKISVRA